MDFPNGLSAVLRRIDAIEATIEPPRAFDAPRFESLTATFRQLPNARAELGPLIEASAKRWGVDDALVRAIVERESGFDPRATSVTGAQGLMQLEPGTAAALGVSDPFDPAQNLDGGTRYIRGLLDRFHGNARLALAAYNAGPHAVEKYGGIPPYAETRAYVEAVLESYRRYSERR